MAVMYFPVTKLLSVHVTVDHCGVVSPISYESIAS